MTDHLTLETMETVARRRKERREFFRAIGAAAAVTGGLGLLPAAPAFAQAAPTDVDVLNFALNLEYLEAQFYSFAAFGQGLPNSLLTGTGTQGPVQGGRQVAFTDSIVRQYAIEIAQDERAHVEFLRTAIGSSTVAQPTVDIRGGAGGPFAAAATAAGLPNGSSFDPYASDENFLLGAFIFEDVGVTAYKGAAPLITNKTFLEASAGILAVEAYHAALIRTTLFQKGIQAPTLIDATEAISNARDSLDGATDLDQGIRPMGTGANTASNIAPLDANGLAFTRSAGQVLNIVYLNKAAVNQGGFFPNGVNGNIKTSAAS